MPAILVIEDKESLAHMLRETLESEGYEVLLAPSGERGVEIMNTQSPDLILTDLQLPVKSGIDVLRISRDQAPLRPVIVMTAFGSVETAVDAMKLGAYDFITKPFDIDHLLMLLSRALENRRIVTENILLNSELSTRNSAWEIIGSSPALTAVAEDIKKAAPAKTTILIYGESGTGKELFARGIHRLSGRAAYPFVAVNCAAIPAELIESELFGHEKGSFTGATGRRIGKFELADKGTLFLDEIGDLDLTLQAKLLRVIQEGEFDRVGAERSIRVDVRIIAATNKDLELAVSKGDFREDLFYRINVFPVRLPPLRERPEDIPLLVDHFLRKHGPRLQPRVTAISDEAMEVLKSLPFKGNIRELENTIERGIILCDGTTLEVSHISSTSIRPSSTAEALPGDMQHKTLEQVAKQATRLAETTRIHSAMKEAGGNKTKAAAILEVSYKTLLNKIKEYGIES